MFDSYFVCVAFVAFSIPVSHAVCFAIVPDYRTLLGTCVSLTRMPLVIAMLLVVAWSSFVLWMVTPYVTMPLFAAGVILHLRKSIRLSIARRLRVSGAACSAHFRVYDLLQQVEDKQLRTDIWNTHVTATERG